jgi:hypothetical protein
VAARLWFIHSFLLASIQDFFSLSLALYSVSFNILSLLMRIRVAWCRFDHILLETTGLANPGPVAAVLWVDDQLESPVRLDSIVTVCVSLGIHPPFLPARVE